MTYPPIYEIISVVPAITNLIGSNPVRCYPFGEAPQGVQGPYVVWQLVTGSPDNYLKQSPDTDSFSVQIDIYSKDAEQCRFVATAFRDALQSVSYITRWGGESRDNVTKKYRVSFDVDFITSRN